MKNRPNWILIAVLLSLVALFGWRAFEGWYGGLAYARGKYYVEHGKYEKALPLLHRGDIGSKRATALWLRAMAYVGHWQEQVAKQVDPAESNKTLIQGHHDYLEALSLSPSSGWYWVELGELYHLWDGLQRMEQGNLLSFLGRGPWAYVGRPGRIAVGLTRIGIQKEPTVFSFHDRLALMLMNYGLEEPALEVVRESARVQPLYYVHDYGAPQWLAPPVFDAFVEGSREALGKTPLMQRGLHLIALGRVEIKRGNYEIALGDLDAALELPGHRLNRADNLYHKGVALFHLQRYDESWDALEASKIHDNVTHLARRQQARLLVETDRATEGLAMLLRLRRDHPANTEYSMEYAEIARDNGDLEAAKEALRSVVLLSPDDRTAQARLIRVYIESEDMRSAARQLDELERRTGQTFDAMRNLIEGSQPSTPSLSDL